MSIATVSLRGLFRHLVPLWTAAILAASCTSTPVVDRPDAALPWPTTRRHLVVPDAGLGFITNSGSDTMTVMDLATGVPFEEVRVGVNPLANEGPHHMAIDPVARRLFVEYSYPPPGIPSGPHAGHGSSTTPGWVQSLSLDDLHEIARHELEANPGDLTTTSDGRRVIITHFNLAETEQVLASGGTLQQAYSSLWILDAADLHRIASIPVCVMAHGIEVSPDDTRLYVACNGQDSLAIVHLDDPSYPVEPLIPVGPGASNVPSLTYGPYGVLVTEDGQFVVISDQDGGDLRVFDVAAHAFLPQGIRTRSSMVFGTESPDGRYLYFPGQSPPILVRVRRQDWQIDLAQPVATSDCLYPHDIQIGPDGLYYVLCEAIGTDVNRVARSALDRFDPWTLAITARMPVGVFPHDMVFLGN